MSAPVRHLLYWVVCALGLGLLVAGIITGVHGATVIGMIVAAVSLSAWLRWRGQG